MGNDDTSTKNELKQVADKIFSQIRHEKKKSECPRHKRISAILKRLGRESDHDTKSVLNKLIQPLSSGNERENARKVVLDAIESYEFNCDENLCKTESCNCIISSWTQEDMEIKPLFESAVFPNWFVDILRHNHFFFQSQVEEPSRQSCVSACSSIIFSIAATLKSEDGNLQTSVTARKDSRKLALIHLSSQNCDIQDLGKDPLDFVIRFWCSNTDVSKMELATVTLFVVLHEEYEIFLKIKENAAMQLAQYDRETVHSLSNFQAVLYFSTCLTRLEKSSDKDILPMKNWSGFDCYSIIHGFNDEDQLVKKVEEHCCVNKFRQFNEIFTKHKSSTSSRLNIVDQPKRRRQRRVKTKEKVEKRPEEDQITSEEESQTLDDLNNRFGKLLAINA